ncbi:MAG: hypothetical protein FJ294_02305 [Planctomycetes bacterium]|nr:hypothetical protein [Planctomycetota bacterium]
MPTPSSLREAEVLVANLSRGYAGVAATMRALVPLQQRERAVAFLDRARMGLAGTLSFAQALRQRWKLVSTPVRLCVVMARSGAFSSTAPTPGSP